jgi:hypothetical protein
MTRSVSAELLQLSARHRVRCWHVAGADIQHKFGAAVTTGGGNPDVYARKF